MKIAEVNGYNNYLIENVLPENNIESKNLGKHKSFTQILDELQSAEKSSSVISQGQRSSAFKGKGELLKGLQPNSISEVHLPGDYISSFKIKKPVEADFKSPAKGVASGFGKSNGVILQNNTVDKTSKLYEQALELESYFVKIMIDSMRNTLSGKTISGDESFAGKMYNDMMYEELGRNVTENAGFGLADQIYLEFYRSK